MWRTEYFFSFPMIFVVAGFVVFGSGCVVAFILVATRYNLLLMPTTFDGKLVWLPLGRVRVGQASEFAADECSGNSWPAN